MHPAVHMSLQPLHCSYSPPHSRMRGGGTGLTEAEEGVAAAAAAVGAAEELRIRGAAADGEGYAMGAIDFCCGGCPLRSGGVGDSGGTEPPGKAGGRSGDLTVNHFSKLMPASAAGAAAPDLVGSTWGRMRAEGLQFTARHMGQLGISCPATTAAQCREASDRGDVNMSGGAASGGDLAASTAATVLPTANVEPPTEEVAASGSAGPALAASGAFTRGPDIGKAGEGGGLVEQTRVTRGLHSGCPLGVNSYVGLTSVAAVAPNGGTAWATTAAGLQQPPDADAAGSDGPCTTNASETVGSTCTAPGRGGPGCGGHTDMETGRSVGGRCEEECKRVEQERSSTLPYYCAAGAVNGGGGWGKEGGVESNSNTRETQEKDPDRV